MIHVNEKLKDVGRIWEELIFPEAYISQTVEDFLRNKDCILPTKKVLPPAVFYYGAAAIFFPVLNFKFDKSFKDGGILYDTTNLLNVNLKKDFLGFKHYLLDKEHLNSLRDGLEIYQVCVDFEPKSNLATLMSFSRGPKSKKTSREPRGFFELNLSTA